MGERDGKQIQLRLISWVTLKNNSTLNSDLTFSFSKIFPVLHSQSSLMRLLKNVVIFMWLYLSFCICSIMGWMCVPPELTCWSPSPYWDGIWRQGLWEVTRLRLDNNDPHAGVSALVRRGRYIFLCPGTQTKERPWEHTNRRQLSVCQEDNPHQTGSLPAP